MQWFWPFWKRDKKGDAQRQQIEESMQRVSRESDRRVEVAKARLDAAADGASEVAERRKEESTHLREAIKTMIDRQTNQRFNMQRGPSRN